MAMIAIITMIFSFTICYIVVIGIIIVIVFIARLIVYIISFTNGAIIDIIIAYVVLFL